jgi:FkbM family methyltransferase
LIEKCRDARGQETCSPLPPDAPASDELIRTLYGYLLGRQPEPAVLLNMPALLSMPALFRGSGDVAAALRAVLESDEFKRHHPREALAAKAYARLGRRPRLIDVGAQTLGPGSHIYDALMRYCEIEIIGFDPLQERLVERQAAEGGAHLTLLPYALGDGREHTLYINNHDATSSLYPLNPAGNAPFPLLAQLQTVRTETVATRRLDDVVPHEPVDFLKLDVQGGELLILKHACEVLKQTSMIHCEVEFSPIYLGQPLFGDVAAFLAEHGFYFADFTFLGHYPAENRMGFNTNDRLMWADALFLRRDPSIEVKASQALSLALIYHKFALADHLLSS